MLSSDAGRWVDVEHGLEEIEELLVRDQASEGFRLGRRAAALQDRRSTLVQGDEMLVARVEVRTCLSEQERRNRLS